VVVTTLVTGIGLVGTAFAQSALARDEEVVFYDFQPRQDYLAARLGGREVAVVQRDVRDLPALVEALLRYRVTTVVHTAGLIGDKVSDPLYTGLQVNVMGTVNVLEAVRLAGVRRLVHVSTFGVYDPRRAGTGSVDETAARGPGRAYGNSKVVKELLAETYQLEYGFELIMLRVANAYGLGHFWGGSGAEKIQRLLEAGASGRVATIPQHQTMAFEYVYSRDVGRALDLAATVPLPDESVFNIGSGAVTSFEQLVAAIRGLYPDLRVEVTPTRPPAVSATNPLRIDRAKEHLGWTPEYDLEAGLRDYADELAAAAGYQPGPARDRASGGAG
jgi:nucleoside-diphosphate-sugar epimerase